MEISWKAVKCKVQIVINKIYAKWRLYMSASLVVSICVRCSVPTDSARSEDLAQRCYFRLHRYLFIHTGTELSREPITMITLCFIAGRLNGTAILRNRCTFASFIVTKQATKVQLQTNRWRAPFVPTAVFLYFFMYNTVVSL